MGAYILFYKRNNGLNLDIKISLKYYIFYDMSRIFILLESNEFPFRTYRMPPRKSTYLTCGNEIHIASILPIFV